MTEIELIMVAATFVVGVPAVIWAVRRRNRRKSMGGADIDGYGSDLGSSGGNDGGGGDGGGD